MLAIFNVWFRFLCLLTPFFVLSLFLAMTRDLGDAERRRLAVRVTLAVMVICVFLFFFGNALFRLLGITLDAFRIGAGVLLMLSAISLVKGFTPPPRQDHEDIAVVPLAIPITVGPATTGALLVMGAETTGGLVSRLPGCCALIAAAACVGVVLYLAPVIERLITRKGIDILSKLTGVILAALAAQMVCTGISGFFGIP